MQIALFHNMPSGGAKRAIYEWTRRLSLEHTIDVYTLSSADHEFCDIRPYVRKHQIIEFKSRRSFSRPFGRLNQFQRWSDLGELCRIGKQIASKIDHGGYDTVLAHTCMFSSIPIFLQFLETPAIYYLHEPFGRQFSRNIERPYAKKNMVRNFLDRLDPFIRMYNHRLDLLQQKSRQNTNIFLANSLFISERMKAAFCVAAPVSHIGVDFEMFYPLQIELTNNHVLSVGELTPRKGFDFLVESLSHIPSNQRPALHLACNWIDAQEFKYLQELAGIKGVDLQVKLNLDVEQLRDAYNSSKFCVFAPVLEPFGLVPLEAMSCGKPVIGVREGGVTESIVHEQTGLLVERDPEKFAAAIQQLISNPDLAQEYGRNGREHVLKNWTWDQSVASLENHLEACAKMN